MIESMRKIADTIVGFKRSKGSPNEGPLMLIKDNVRNYEELVKERRELVKETRKSIQNRIEAVCRVQNHIKINDLGFETTSPHLFEDSWQEKVVKMLEKDGYLCIMTFRYRDGKPENYLTVKW